MRALLLGALLISLLGSEAAAQRRLRVLGTLAADGVTLQVAVRDDGDAGILATHGGLPMWCGADPRTIRDWVRDTRRMLDSVVAIGGRGATLIGACGIRLVRTAEGAAIELADPRDPTRVSA